MKAKQHVLDSRGRSSRSNLGRVSASAVIAALALGISACTGYAETTSATSPSNSANDPKATTPATEQTTTPENGELTVKKVEIPAGLSAEELGKTIVEGRWSDWVNAGASDQLRYDRLKANESWGEYLPKVADNNTSIFESALYEDNWQSNPNLVTNVTNSASANLAVLKWYVTTAWSGDEKPQNKEGFRSWMTVDKVTEVDDGDNDNTTRTVEVAYTNKTNGNMNEGPKLDPNDKGVWTISTKTVNGVEKITNVQNTHS